MTNPLLRKLDGLAKLSAGDKRALADAMKVTRVFAPDQDIVREGDRPSECHVLLDGFACRYKILSEGQRQIIGFQIPGDFCDLTGFVMGRMDHAVASLTPVTTAVIPHRKMEELVSGHPALARAFWRETLADASISREWVANVGARSAYQRLAHLLTEMGLRLKAAGFDTASGFEWPFTQAEVGDATGMSTVHVNRMLQQLRAEKVIELTGSQVSVPDWDRLLQAGGFRPDFLFLQHQGRSL